MFLPLFHKSFAMKDTLNSIELLIINLLHTMNIMLL